MALYRKYRPTKLSDVVGQTEITSSLENAIKQDKISHAYLFIGPRGTGKTSVARILAHAINQFDYQVEDSYLDIIEIDAASNTGVDNIRELREKAVIAPTEGKYKIYIIDEVHMLTKSAANALLKTLEEPPAHVVFIMATTDAHKVPITISSRTQVYNFQLARPEVMLQHLQKIVQKERLSIDDAALKVIIRRGGGSFRDTLSLLDQISSLSKDKITAEVVNRTLGLPQEEIIAQVLMAYSTGDGDKIHELLYQLLNNGLRAETIASELIEQIMQSPNSAVLDLLGKLPDVKPPFPEAKLLLALVNGKKLTQNRQTTAPNTAKVAEISQTEADNTKNVPSKTTIQNKSAEVAEVVAKKVQNPEKSTESSVAKTHHSDTQDKNEEGSDNSGKSTNEPETPKTAPNDTKITPDMTQNGDFDWLGLLSRLEENHAALYAQLSKCDYIYADDTLHLYPKSRFTKSFLDKDTHRQTLLGIINGPSLVIHNVGETKPGEDPTISQISAIMGGVQDVDGEMPF